jgi:hypothetical protein
MWGLLAKQVLKAGVKKVAKDKLFNRKKKRPKKRASGKEVADGIMNKGEEGKKGGALAVRPTTGLVHTKSDFDPVSTTPGESDIVIIRKQVIQVRDILKDTQSAKQQERKNLRKAKQVDKKKKEEEKIEKPKIKPKEVKVGMKVPNLGLGIANFLTWLAIGVVFAKLNELMPTLKKIFGVLGGIAKFIGHLLNFALGAVVGFIDLAYAGVENLRKLIVAIGGEGAGELFDKFGTLFTQVMNGALIAAMIGAVIGRGRRNFRRGKPPQDGRVPDTPDRRPRTKTPRWQKKLQQWWKKTPMGKFFRNQKAGWKRFTRSVARGPLGKVASVLNPKNIGNWINTGGVDKALKGGVRNVTKFVQNLRLPKSLQQIQLPKSIQNLTKNIKPVETIQNLTKNIQLPKSLRNIQPGKTIQNLTKTITESPVTKRIAQTGSDLLQKVTSIKPGETIQNITKTITESPVTKRIAQTGSDLLQKVTSIKPGETIQNLTKTVTESPLTKRITQTGGDLLQRAKDFKPGETIQNITKNLTSGGGPGLFSRIGSTLGKAKDAIGSGFKNAINAARNIKWGELPGVKQARGAFEGITGSVGKWVDDVAKNLDPGKMVQGLIDKVKPNIDEFLGKNPLLKKLGGKIEPKTFVPWIADNFQKFSKQAEPIAKAVKGNKALKSMSNFLGPVDIVIDSLFALVDYAAGGESLVNAVVKALSSSLGFAAGAAAGASLTSTATFFTAGAGAPLIPFVTFGMGMGGALLGEQLGNLILKALVQIPALADMDDPIAEEMGLSPRKIIRDPWGEKGEETGDDISTDTSGGSDTTKPDVIASSGGNNKAEGLDTKPSYGDGKVVENSTTYIQLVEG